MTLIVILIIAVLALCAVGMYVLEDAKCPNCGTKMKCTVDTKTGYNIWECPKCGKKFFVGG